MDTGPQTKTILPLMGIGKNEKILMDPFLDFFTPDVVRMNPKNNELYLDLTVSYGESYSIANTQAGIFSVFYFIAPLVKGLYDMAKGVPEELLTRWPDYCLLYTSPSPRDS